MSCFFLKILKVATSESKKDKPKKIQVLIPKFKSLTVNYFAPTLLMKMDDKFVDALVAIEAPKAPSKTL